MKSAKTRSVVREMMNNTARSYLVLHALWLSLGAATALGLARFAYALILPPMKDALGWTYAQAGAMNSANAVGYLVGALAANSVLTRWSPRLAFIATALITAASLIASGTTANYAVLQALRVLGGIASAVLFIAGGLLGAQLASADRSRAGLLLGIYYGGVGIGLMLSGICIPWLLHYPMRDAWRWAWVILGMLSLIPAGCALWTRLPVAAVSQAGGQEGGRGLSRLFWALCSYFLFGAGYIGYMTFVIAALREGGHGSWWFVSGFWGLLGLAAFLSSWIWAWLIDRSSAGRGLALLLAVVCAGAAVPALTTLPWAMLISAVLFGAALLSVVAATTALVRKALPAERWARGIAAFTIAFAFGQMAGPVLVGKVIDISHSNGAGLAMSALPIGLAACIACLQPRVDSIG